MKKLTFNFPTVHCLVSFKEMYSIFWKNPEYEVFRSLHELEKPESFDGYEMSYDDAPWESSDTPLLYRHIIAEQLYKKKEKWAEEFPHDYFHVGLLLRLTKLWMNPLKWQWRIDWDDDFKDMVIEGRVAKEVYCSEREDQVRKMLNDYYMQYVLDFANEFPICEEDDPQHGKIKGLHYWTMITWNNDPLFERILDGNECNEGELAKTKGYDAAYLRKNLTIIAEKCGGERARYLLMKLQQEWKQIKIWRSDSEVMTERDIRLFEESIFHGFDDLLAEWKQEAEQSSTRGPKETIVFRDKETAQCETERFLSFINKHKMREDDVDAAWDNRVNQVAVCFYRIWKEKNMLMAKAGGTSLSRFIINCGLSISVKEKAHGNALNRMIQSDDMFSMYVGDVRASFYN